MAITLIETAGAASANTYITLTDADTYFADYRLHVSTWASAATANRNTALAWATRLLDEMCNWFGSKASTEQALAWPRAFVYTPDGDRIEDTEIPQWLKFATAEMAYFLLSEDRTLEAGRDSVGIKAMQVGPIEIDFDSAYSRTKSVMPPSVWSMVRSYCVRRGRGGKTLVRC